MTPRRKRGRPRLDLPERVKARICREVALGKSLRRILKTGKSPSMAKVMTTLAGDPKFAEQYARARKQGIELHIDGILDLADKATAENAHAVRLRVDTRKWLASKLVPKVYGERMDADLGDEIRAPVNPENVSDLEIARRIVHLLKLGERQLESMNLSQLAKFLRVEKLVLGLRAPRALPAPVELEVEAKP